MWGHGLNVCVPQSSDVKKWGLGEAVRIDEGVRQSPLMSPGRACLCSALREVKQVRSPGQDAGPRHPGPAGALV